MTAPATQQPKWLGPLEMGPGDGESCFCGYGFFPGGDPRRFRPDEDGTHREEWARWVSDCRRWDAAEAAGQTLPPEPSLSTQEQGVFLDGSAYGLGSYQCDDCAARAVPR